MGKDHPKMTEREASQRQTTVDLYVRSLTPQGQHATHNDVIARLDDLEAMGAIARYNVHVWGRQVAPASATGQTEAGQIICDRVAAFQRWADQAHRSLDPFFETRAVQSAYTDETYETLVLPAVALAEYEGDDLTFVAPSTAGETVTTVHDRLDALDTTEPADDHRTEFRHPQSSPEELPNA